MKKPIVLILLTAIIAVSTASIMVRFSTAHPLVIAFYRVLFTGFLALILCKITNQPLIASISKLQLLRAAGAGLFLALHFSFWFTSLSCTSIASSVLFTNLQVVFVWLFSVLLLHETIHRGAALGILLALTGSFLIAGGDWQHGGHLAGDLISLASGFFVAFYFLIGRKARAVIEIWPYTVVVSFSAAFFLGLAVIVSGTPFVGISAADYGLFLLMAIIPGIGGHGMFNLALKYVKAPIVSVAVLGESIGASLLGYLIFQESLSLYQSVGGALILAGLCLALTLGTNATDPPAGFQGNSG